MNVSVKLLSERPDWLCIVAGWIYSEWWTHVPNASPDVLAELLQPNLTSDSVPVTIVAAMDGDPVGTVRLLEHDLDTDMWPDLTPWLAALYVEPKSRQLGIGTRLVIDASSIAYSFGYDVLYLLTSGEEAFYAKRGWVPIDRSDGRVVMSLSAFRAGTAV